MRLITRLRECHLQPVADLQGRSGKMSPWQGRSGRARVENVSGALNSKNPFGRQICVPNWKDCIFIVSKQAYEQNGELNNYFQKV